MINMEMKFLMVFNSVSALWLVVESALAKECRKANPADILFILDGSGSVGSENFSRSLEFIAKLADSFRIGPADTRMALIVFDGDTSLEFSFDKHKTSTALRNAIFQTRYPGGFTDICKALKAARYLFLNFGRRESTTEIAILITDGVSQDSANTIEAARGLKSDRVTIYTAGVGGSVNKNELKQIASNELYYFHSENYDVLDRISGPLAGSACADLNGCLCFNGGTCIEGNIGFKCNCPATYTGFYCEKTICEVASPCDHGRCEIAADTLHCSCYPGYTGNFCNIDIDDCFNNQCQNGSCVDSINDYSCSCYQGYTGWFCETDINECASRPCVNGGTCNDLVNHFTCDCKPGYTGITCEKDINECLSQPCEHGGTCDDRINSFFCDCPFGYYGDFCETGICQPSVADLVFILDSSISQTEFQFHKQLEFIEQFIDKIVISENDFQVSVVTFSTDAKIEINLGQYRDNNTLKEAVRGIPFRPGATFTHKGLRTAIQVVQNHTSLRPYGKRAKPYAFVITDGMSTDRKQTKEAAEELRLFFHRVLAIGIGSEVSHEELLTIASSDPQNNRKFVYSVENFNALYNVVKDLVRLTCDECTWTTSSDIMFLLDTSASIAGTDFQTALNAITYLTHKTSNMETANNTVRIALLTYGSELILVRNIDSADSKGSFLASLQMVRREDEVCLRQTNDCASSNLDEALEQVRRTRLTPHGKPTNDTQQIVIILTDGGHEINEKAQHQLSELRKVDISVYSIALGAEARIANLQKLVGDAALVYLLYDETHLEVLDALITEFFSSACVLSNDF